MNILDIRESDGPFWAAYQRARRRDQIIDNPDYVPEWFLQKLLYERLVAARTAVAALTPVDGNPEGPEYVAVVRACDTLARFVQRGSVLDSHRSQLIAGLLGAEEIETDREFADEGLETKS